MIAEKGFENLRVAVRGRAREGPGRRSAAQNLDQLLELEAHLVDELLALVEVHLGIVAVRRLRAPPMVKPCSYRRLRIWRMMSTSWRW